jgi:xanthine/CO dehydrogenase XdhC/CoxF family maturation factor
MSICVYHRVVITADVAAGRDAVRPHLAFYVGAMGSKKKQLL